MSLFSKSNGDKIINNLIGGTFFKSYFTDLIEINGLKEFNIENKENWSIAHDIERILKNKFKRGEISEDEIEPYFYFLIKQAIYITKHGGFHLVYVCPNCSKRIDDYKHCLLSCWGCNTSFFNQYIIDYDKLNEIEIIFPNNNHPYKNMDDKISSLIKRYKSDCLKEKLNPNIEKSANKLGVSKEECYLVEVKIVTKSYSNKLLQIALSNISDDKISFVSFGQRLLTGDIDYSGDISDIEVIPINFEDVYEIKHDDKIIVIYFNNQELVAFQTIFNNNFSNDLLEKYIAFKETEKNCPNESIEEDVEIPDDINPMEKIKEAKELLDIGAISQEEFDEIKAKYMKFV